MPEEGWTAIANSAHRDYRLSWRARGLLGELLSYPDGWDTTIDKLVAQAREHGDATEGRAAMRAAVAELAAIGYVRYIREADARGHWTTVMSVCDVPQPEPDVRRTRNRTVGGPDRRKPGTSENRNIGGPDRRDTETSEGRSITKKKDTKTVTKTGSEVKCSTSGRFAPSGAAETNDQHADDEGTRTPDATNTRWRLEDRDLFLNIIGSQRIQSAGINGWNRGTFRTEDLYEALRAKGRNPMKWPGRYLDKLCYDDPTTGLVNWLDDQGFEPVVAT